VKVSEFNYELPESHIAQEPLADRSSSRMLHLARHSGELHDRSFSQFPDFLRPDDLVVFNNTRVFPARLFGRRSGTKAQHLGPNNPAAKDFLHGKIEVLLTQQISQDPNEWECLVRPGRKIGVGETLYFGEQDELKAEVISRGSFGESRIRFAPSGNFWGLVDALGHIPLPPYIDRADRASDRDRYQTIYAKERGSVAAPTAGLHFTPEILSRIHERCIETAEITLHVGLGTFQPVRVADVEQHKLHREAYFISEETAEAINRARDAVRRIVAVGTTSVRTLEYTALQNEKIMPGSGFADLFIYPGFKFQVVGGMLTNFHLPESTLLMLVCAFGGKEKVMSAYEHAVKEQYRFYSYGDCMFLE
jgi:S-adenosylmethionine:tRNA ribosyltransferase-isomerase